MGTRRGSGRAPRVRQGARGWGDTCHIVGSSTSWSPSAHSCCSNSSNSSSSCGSRCAAVRGESAPNRRRAVEPLAVMGGRRPVPRDPMPRRRGLGCRRGGGGIGGAEETGCGEARAPPAGRGAASSYCPSQRSLPYIYTQTPPDVVKRRILKSATAFCPPPRQNHARDQKDCADCAG